VEHAYQASKTVVPEERARIAAASTPGQAKRLGRKLTLRSAWDTLKLATMRSLVQQKFTDRALAVALLGTDDAELVEGNTWGDVYWGVCNGVGENHLGKILMEIRTTLKSVPLPEQQVGVQIIERKTGKVVEFIDCHGGDEYHIRNCRDGVEINLNHADFKTQLVLPSTPKAKRK
jgi:ribA/ribD-fused uncharacterized protein